MTSNNSNYNNNNNNNMDDYCIPGLQLMCLTPEEDEYQYDDYIGQEDEEITYNWIDDCECQENLATILSLNPEECIIDSDNHIQNMDGIQLFLEELGFLCEEPEPIDPTRDYEAEAKILIEERNKTRKQHIDLSPMPSLDDTTTSGISSTSSSFHGTDEGHHTLMDIRSPLYMGHCSGGGQTKTTAYAYAPHVFCPIRTPI